MLNREPANRKSAEIRPLTIDLGVNRYAEGSVLVKAGHTHVLCTASIDEGVPPWLKGKGKGWVTAEYAMLPRSTHTRSKRDREKVSGRTQEIQRLIGRALRACVDLAKLGERQIIVDCDVLQADGGTRTASITGGCVALGIAIKKLASQGLVPADAFKETVCGISIGIHGGEILADLDYNEDSTCEVDMNFVITGSGKLVEVQGTAENGAFSVEQMNGMTQSALNAATQIRAVQLARI